MVHTKNEEDDDILIYDTSPTRWQLFNIIITLRMRIQELEKELEEHKNPKQYFGEK